jgi:hypothetical protein
MSHGNIDASASFHCPRPRPYHLLLPPEIWLMILDDMDLGRSTLRAARLTCHTFSDYAKTILFRSFRLGIAVSSASLPHYIERLAFWSSDPIAHLVKDCHVYVINNEIHSSPVLRAFFKYLPLFVNLLKLRCGHFSVSFNACALRQISRLQCLTDLVIENCSITAAQPTIPGIKLNNLTIDHRMSFIHDTSDWWSVVQPDYLRRVQLCCLSHEDAAQQLNALLLIMPIPNLRELTLRVQPSSINIRFLVHAPLLTSQIQILNLGIYYPHPTISSRGLPSGSVLMPLLREYVGPAHLLKIFIPGTSLRALKLDHTTPLIQALHEFPQTFDNLEHLAFHFITITTDTLNTICSRFVHLKSLWMEHLRLRLDGSESTACSPPVSLPV